MKQFFINLYNRLFKSDKCFVVWSYTERYWHKNMEVEFTYFIKYFPYKLNKYVLDCNPHEHHGDGKHYYHIAKWKNQTAYPKAFRKLQEYQREELIDMIQLPTMEGINK